MARPESPPAETGIFERHAENSDQHKEDVLAGDGWVWAGARRVVREGDGVDIPGGTEDEEIGLGTVEKEEGVAEGPEDSVGDGLGGTAGAEVVAIRRRVVGFGGHVR